MRVKDTKVGQKLYLNYYDSDKDKVIQKEVYATKVNTQRLYFSTNPHTDNLSYQWVKSSGKYPKIYRANFLEMYYLSDIPEFTGYWEKHIEQRAYYHKTLTEKLNAMLMEGNTKKLRLVADKLDYIDRYTTKDYWEEGK
ncbi:hypothetical protein HOU39_gp084 [Lactobacillus phage Iacchus]|uniref:Uncharacterized protein n=3 Tax=Harbinvirus TaxID=2732970 RepID=A0A3S7UQ65_9CAUD|nr:hypothetical protein HOS78_gp081 [Lactobacillus phage Bacchae]YP_009814301.1 hypothetical protein HOU39_gp084 [Lactobacillus phage Iacchus]YP_009814471.1 hypothetical protein HOU40_gp084 [Lactobacillus phage Bromius]AYH92150.1 hypothetical protein [Lactobacillus phage Dionysus]AUV60017.1 hypothetical protein [Lactobacillus phage Bacchae]AYH91978.1 hypothetical protein [Lactobacillus phage Iacchus]AYH92320.1 hypothetical protein [Lactobacillus phage Bromius]